MTWFLRLFSVYADLEAMLEMQERQRADIDAKLDVSDASVNRLLVENEALRTETASLSEDLDNIRQANQEMVTEKLILQDRLESAISDKDKLWEQMQRALDGERYALQTMANASTQKSGGGIPFPDAHSLPAASVRVQESGAIGRSARVLPSEMAMRATNQYVRDFVQSLDPDRHIKAPDK